jgi:hypothetical protein
MSTQYCTGIEVTIAAILAAQECGDYAAIEAARTGGSAWDDYVARYVGNYTYEDFTLALLTQAQSAELRWQVLDQAALLPNSRFSEGPSPPRQTGDGRE